jgi:hypothetical protein
MRSEPRFMCSDLVQVRVHQETGTVTEAIANLEDISPAGACIHLEKALAHGVNVELVCANCRLRGQVRYCRFVGYGYDVGLQFDQPGAWQPQLFAPQHLLDVATVETVPPGSPEGGDQLVSLAAALED